MGLPGQVIFFFRIGCPEKIRQFLCDILASRARLHKGISTTVTCVTEDFFRIILVTLSESRARLFESLRLKFHSNILRRIQGNILMSPYVPFLNCYVLANIFSFGKSHLTLIDHGNFIILDKCFHSFYNDLVTRFVNEILVDIAFIIKGNRFK